MLSLRFLRHASTGTGDGRPLVLLRDRRVCGGDSVSDSVSDWHAGSGWTEAAACLCFTVALCKRVVESIADYLLELLVNKLKL